LEKELEQNENEEERGGVERLQVFLKKDTFDWIAP
jgi:hypothetical protein